MALPIAREIEVHVNASKTRWSDAGIRGSSWFTRTQERTPDKCGKSESFFEDRVRGAGGGRNWKTKEAEYTGPSQQQSTSPQGSSQFAQIRSTIQAGSGNGA
jgi:hypothetical protein